MENNKRNELDTLARQAALDNYRVEASTINPADAWDEVVYRHQDGDGLPTLPARMPAEFAHDFRRYSRLLREVNPFVTCDLAVAQ